MQSGLLSLSILEGLKDGSVLLDHPLIKGAALIYPQVVWFASVEGSFP
jgi:hypothetical protein